jgi:hypothetical protein
VNTSAASAGSCGQILFENAGFFRPKPAQVSPGEIRFSDLAAQADAGFGYLFDHADAAAKLGRQQGADWVLVGRLHKPSFLFAYIMAHLVDAHTGRLVGNYVVEVKGPPRLVTAKGVERLANQIDQTIHPRAPWPRSPRTRPTELERAARHEPNLNRCWDVRKDQTHLAHDR